MEVRECVKTMVQGTNEWDESEFPVFSRVAVENSDKYIGAIGGHP
jgi:hypothetical protein